MQQFYERKDQKGQDAGRRTYRSADPDLIADIQRRSVSFERTTIPCDVAGAAMALLLGSVGEESRLSLKLPT